MNPFAQRPEENSVYEAGGLLSLICDTSPRLVVLFDTDFNIKFCNSATYELFGFKSKEDLFVGFVDYVTKYTPEFLSNGQRSISIIDRLKSVTLEKPVRFETELCIDSEMRFYDVEMKKVPYGEIFPIVVFISDITDIRKGEIALRRAYEENERQLVKLNMAVHATKIGLWEMEIMKDDPVNPINRVIWSDEVRHMIGFENENDFPNLVGSWQGRMHPDDRPRNIEALKKHLGDATGKTPYDVEGRIQNKDGRYSFYRATAETVRDAEGNPVRIIGAMMDITETKKLLLANEIQLTKLHLMLKATKIVLWDMEIAKGDTDPVNDMRPFHWSDDFRNLLGFSDENDFPNQVGSFNDCLHPDDKERNISMFEAHLLDRTGKTPYDIEVRLKKKNGEYSYYRATGETIRDAGGNPLRVAGSLMDISETKQFIQEIERQRSEAENANKAKTAFLSAMSHEIRTPMNAILGIAEIQLQSEVLANAVRDAFEKVYSSGDLLLGIINDLLDFAKIEAGKMELSFAEYALASLINDIVHLNMMLLGSKPVEFRLSVDENIPLNLLGDELRIKQILNNLLSNAFKYTLEGSIELAITAEPSQDNADMLILVIRVSDTGQGMTSDQVEKLFDAYARFNLETNRATEGTGLGMTITQNLINMMQGEIIVESVPGKGSVFTVRLPQGKTGSGSMGKEMVNNLCQFRTSGMAQMKRVRITREPMPYGSVLIVDDVETNIYVARGLLLPYGLRIDSVTSGMAAIEKIKNGSVYDIVFMDHMMPEIDGIEATKILRGMGYIAPIVALTANAVSGQEAVFRENGFNDFISKPIDIRQLNAVLNKLIRDKQPPEVLAKAREHNVTKKTQFADPAHKGIDPAFTSAFLRDAQKAGVTLTDLAAKNDYSNEENLRSFVICVHGLKSVFANIGELDLSAVAAKLEQAGRTGNLELIAAATPDFLNSLRSFIGHNKLREETEIEDVVETMDDKRRLAQMLLEIKKACENFDVVAVGEALATLRKAKWARSTNKILDKISEHLLHSGFDEIVEIVDRFA